MTAVNARMTELVRKFVERTGTELAQMRAALARLDAGDRSGLSEVHQFAHRACGTGGTLGLMALSDAAGALERRIEACAPGCILDTAQRERLRADVDAIAAQLALFRDVRA